ncbi:class I tRNA ligase family protein, partial [Fibrobacter sp. UWEL]|uniref:class I tRNA ligase family protein n=1 Tax=Fibrobacter sp. UWEL TaxID=1896209 RepID=UPI00091A5E12
KTMDKNFMESVWWVFKQCFDKGLIYQGYRIQPYSPALATPLSNFETNQGYKDRQDPSLTLIFPLVSDDAKFAGSNILVWTTTPWTLPSNFAIAVKADAEYVCVEQDGKKYWIAESRMGAYFNNPNVVDSCMGSELVGKSYEALSHISDEFVTPDQLSRHYKIVFMEGGSIPLVRTSLLSTPTAGLRRRPATPRLPHPPTLKLIVSNGG